jgi:hypothetical protein
MKNNFFFSVLTGMKIPGQDLEVLLSQSGKKGNLLEKIRTL